MDWREFLRNEATKVQIIVGVVAVVATLYTGIRTFTEGGLIPGVRIDIASRQITEMRSLTQRAADNAERALRSGRTRLQHSR